MSRSSIAPWCLGGLLSLGLLACPDTPPHTQAQTGVRSAAVQPKATSTGPVNDKSGFCELTFPAAGSKARPLVWPAMRPLPGESAAVAPPVKRGNWIWVNLWATWCEPCLAEMSLLGRWTKGLRAGGNDLDLELLTIDAPENATTLQGRIEAGLPGTVRWVRDEPAFGAFLDGLGVDRTAAIPIHALVDPGGQVRCVRVGAISALDFAAVKGIITGR
jgi:thiol-disulfide isomerase/thioredoxin